MSDLPAHPSPPAEASAPGDGPTLTRLPFEIREEICQRIHDNQPYDEINSWLAALGYGPFRPQNFSKFKASHLHYQAWLKQQERLDQRRARADAIRRDLAADGFTVLDGTMLALADSLSDPDLNPVKAASALAALKAATVSASRLEIERRRQQLAEEAAALDRERFEFQKASALHTLLSDEIAREKARAIVADASSSKAEQIAALVRLMNQMEQDTPA